MVKFLRRSFLILTALLALLLLLGVVQVAEPLYLLLIVAAITTFAGLLRLRSSSYALNFIILLVSIGLTLAFAEVTLRLALPLTSVYQYPSKVLMTFSRRYKYLFEYRPNSNLKMASIGDLASVHGVSSEFRNTRQIHFISDSNGLRNSQRSLADSNILLLGDSFGISQGTTQEQTLVHFLEQEIQTTVYNLSFPGSPASQLHRLKALASKIKQSQAKTLIWLLFAGNDLYEPYNLLHKEPIELSPLASYLSRLHSFQVHGRLNLLANSLLSTQERSDILLVKKARFINQTMLFHKIWSEQASQSLLEITEHPNWPNLMTALDMLKAIASEHELELVIFTIPAKATIYHSDYQNWSFADALFSECSNKNIRCFDLTSHLRSSAKELGKSGLSLWWKDDTHWNKYGNQLAAKTIATKVLN